jgi:hypothetical protein
MEESKGNANLDGDWWFDLEDPRLDGFTFWDRHGKGWSRQELLEHRLSYRKPCDDIPGRQPL